jgi:hypothetical protein
MRAARTDKGVSAVCQVVSAQLVLDDPPGALGRINEALPDQVGPCAPAPAREGEAGPAPARQPAGLAALTTRILGSTHTRGSPGGHGHEPAILTMPRRQLSFADMSTCP